jgi:NhaP-type Na+/H+ or K+/H+ antiporter
MSFTHYYIVIGLLLLGVALAGSVVRRLPLSTAMLYVLAGVGLGQAGLGLLVLDPVEDSLLLETLTEVAVIISLFTAGLKLRLPLHDRRWMLALRLAFGSMAITVGLIALVGVLLLGLPLGVAVLLGAILAPTDPVLASDVQVREPGDRDRVRFSLTGEAGLNDGAAFPFVMLGLGLLGLHDIGDYGWRWLAIDVAWAIPAGLAIGALLGTLVGELVLYLRRQHKEAVGLDDFLALGLVALAYGVALQFHAYGFLSVFAAGLAIRRIEARSSGGESPPEQVREAARSSEEAATDPETAPAYMTEAVLAFEEQIERIGELTVMVLVGALLSRAIFMLEALWFVPLLLLVIRPLAVRIGLLGCPVSTFQRRLIGWFGIRGIGSIYYLMFVLEHGLTRPHAETLVALTLSTVTVSVLVHGISVTPVMSLYERRRERERSPIRQPAAR